MSYLEYPEHPAVTLMKKRLVERYAAEIERAVAPIRTRLLQESVTNRAVEEPLVGRDTSLDELIAEAKKKQAQG